MRSSRCTPRQLLPTRRPARRARAGLPALLALTVAAACATRGGPPVVTATATARGMLHVLTADEMRRHADPSVSLHDQVRLLRVGFLQHRDGAEPTVFIDGRYAGPLAVLHDIPARSVREIRLVRGAEVPLRFGQRLHHAVVLDVILQR